MTLDKSNIQISLDDFKSEDIFIFLKRDYKDNLLKKAVFKAGSQSKLAKLLKENINYPKLKQPNISSFIHKRNLRLDIFYLLCEFTDIKFDNKKILGIKGLQTSKMIYNPKIRIVLSKKLVQVLANLYCDGSIEKNNCYVSTYINGCNELIDRFKNNFISCFGNIELYERNSHIKNVRIPCFIGKMLYNKFKLYKDNIPFQIINSSKEIKAKYLQAVFDDEGTINKIHGQIRIKMKPKSYIEDVQKLINELGIKTSKTTKEFDKRNSREYYFFSISGMYNLRKFQKEVDFYHPKKKKILIEHLENIKIENYGYNAKDIVNELLKKHGPLTAKQIGNILNRDKRTIHWHLNNLKKMNLVNYTKLKRKFVYEYLWDIVK